MGDVSRCRLLTQLIALDALGKDHGRSSIGLTGEMIGGGDLASIMTATTKLVQLIVTPTGKQGLNTGIVASELLSEPCTILGDRSLPDSIDDRAHPAGQQSLGVLVEKRIPESIPDHLDHPPAGTVESSFEVLDDAGVARDRAVEPLEITVDHEHEVVETFT